MTPQNILVKEGFKRGSDIKVQLSHLATMIVSNSMHQGYNASTSGVDRVFLAPELATYKMGPKNDVWSVGTILYLLVTGGVTDKRHEERFDFSEEVWYNVSEELKDFMLMAVNVDPQKRASVSDLLSSDFLKHAKSQALTTTPFDETHLTEQGGNLYKFYMAHCLNEIVYRFRLNLEKRKDVLSLKEKLISAKHLSGNNHSRTPDPDVIEINYFERTLVSKFGEYEAERIAGFFRMNNTHHFKFNEAIIGITQLFEEDLDEIIAQCFDKLDITDEAALTVKYIRQGLLVNARTHVNPVMKTHNKALLKHVYDMKSSKTFSKIEFAGYVKQCLENETKERSPSSSIRRSFRQQASSAGRSKEDSHGQRHEGSYGSGSSGTRKQKIGSTPG